MGVSSGEERVGEGANVREAYTCDYRDEGYELCAAAVFA